MITASYGLNLRANVHSSKTYPPPREVSLFSEFCTEGSFTDKSES